MGKTKENQQSQCLPRLQVRMRAVSATGASFERAPRMDHQHGEHTGIGG